MMAWVKLSTNYKFMDDKSTKIECVYKGLSETFEIHKKTFLTPIKFTQYE